jgi:hypothetical protein
VTYSASVVDAISSITVTPTTTHEGATIEARTNAGSYSSVTSASPSGALSLNTGANVIEVLVTAEDGTTTKTYTLNVTRLSADADLAGIVLSSGTLSPTFSSDTTSYTSEVSNATSTLSLTPFSSDTNATVELSVDAGSYLSIESGESAGPFSLPVGDTVFTVRMTSEDESVQQSYVVTVRRRSVDWTLSSLTLSNGTLSPTFDANVITYTASVSNATDSMTVTPTVNQADASIEVQVNDGGYSDLASGDTSDALSLSVGSNEIEVRVTPEDGAPTQTYTVTVTRAQVYTIGGTVTGLTSGTSLTLQNNDTDDLDVLYGDGTDDFTFSTPIDEGSSYTVTITTPSDDLHCVLSSGTGTVPAGNVTDVSISCGKRVFVTSVGHNGSIGVGGADTLCDSEGDAVKSGTYVAWLSTSTVNAIDRVTTGVRFIRPDGTYVSDAATIDAGGDLSATISQLADGTDVTNQRVWTAPLAEKSMARGTVLIGRATPPAAEGTADPQARTATGPNSRRSTARTPTASTVSSSRASEVSNGSSHFGIGIRVLIRKSVVDSPPSRAPFVGISLAALHLVTSVSPLQEHG